MSAMANQRPQKGQERRVPGRQVQRGMTLVELMVALAIGSFLLIGAVTVYNQSRQAYAINEAISRVQETAQFALDTIEADLRMASNFGLTGRGDAIVGGSTAASDNPLNVTLPTNEACGATWVLDLADPVEATNGYGLACAAADTAQANSDTLTIRRASTDPVALDATRLQVLSDRLQGQVIDDGALPSGFTATNSQTHNLVVNSYYVDQDSDLIPGVPTLRRKSLGVDGGVPAVIDLEVAPGVENLQVQFGLDMDGDGTVDRYVNPDDAIIDPAAAGFVPAARVMTARVWIIARSFGPELGIEDGFDYEPGDVDLGVPDDDFRRLMVSKTILLRNSRSRNMGT